MSETKTLSDRIDALEARAMFQDDAIKAITEQWRTIEALTRQLAALSERLRETDTQAPGAPDEPPPHY